MCKKLNPKTKKNTQKERPQIGDDPIQLFLIIGMPI